MAAQKPTADEQTAMATGNVLAESFIDAIREGSMPVDSLMYAAYLVGRAGPEAQATLRGFYQRIVEELRTS